MKIIQNFVKLYSSTYIDGEDYNAVICHGKILSMYDMLNFKWKSHLTFDSDISFMFYVKWSNRYMCLMLADGQVLSLNFNKVVDGVLTYDKCDKFEGEIIRYNYDSDGLWPLYVTLKDEDNY